MRVKKIPLITPKGRSCKQRDYDAINHRLWAAMGKTRADSHLAENTEEVPVAFVAAGVVRALALVKNELVVLQQKPLHEHAQDGPPRSCCEPRGRASSCNSIWAALLHASAHEPELRDHCTHSEHDHRGQKHACRDEQVGVAGRPIEVCVAENCANHSRWAVNMFEQSERAAKTQEAGKYGLQRDPAKN